MILSYITSAALWFGLGAVVGGTVAGWARTAAAIRDGREDPRIVYHRRRAAKLMGAKR